MARSNEYDSEGRIILRDTQGTIISMYRFMQLVLGPNSHPWAPPYYWGGYAGHKGYDFGAPAWTPIRSTCTGNVVQSNGGGGWHGGMGNSVVIEETGLPLGHVARYHRYMHMVTDPVVKIGDVVQQGTLLGYVGTTGDSNGTHLHYDVASWSGGGTIYDAWAQFNHSSEPAGWTPQQVTNASGSPWGTSINWDCIGETTGIDYGPGTAGGTPAEVPKTFYTNLDVHDVSYANMANLNAVPVQSVGGLIIQIGNMSGSNDTINHLNDFKRWVSTYKGKIPLGFYVYSYIPFTLGESEIKRKFKIFLNALETEGIAPKDAPLGIWLDLEWSGPTPTADRSLNFKQVQWFREVFAAKGYPTVGLYTAPGYITSYFNVSDCAQIPLWMACWIHSDGSGTASSRSVMETLLINTIGQASYNALKDKIYLWQDGTKTYTGGLLDHDWVMQPIPGVGYEYTDPDNDDSDPEPSYNPSIGIPEVIAPYTVSTIPDGGYIGPTVMPRIVTDIPEELHLQYVIRYTIDNTIPTASNGITYTTARKFWESLDKGKSEAFVRIVVLEALTLSEIARNSATFFIRWNDPKTSTATALKDEEYGSPYLAPVD